MPHAIASRKIAVPSRHAMPRPASPRPHARTKPPIHTTRQPVSSWRHQSLTRSFQEGIDINTGQVSEPTPRPGTPDPAASGCEAPQVPSRKPVPAQLDTAQSATAMKHQGGIWTPNPSSRSTSAAAEPAKEAFTDSTQPDQEEPISPASTYSPLPTSHIQEQSPPPTSATICSTEAKVAMREINYAVADLLRDMAIWKREELEEREMTDLEGAHSEGGQGGC